MLIQLSHSKLAHKKEKELQWKSEWAGSEIMLSHGSCDSRGVAVLLKEALTLKFKILDPVGRFTTFNEHLSCTPNKDKEIVKFFKDLTAVLKKENLDTEENIIVGGDFNCPTNPIIDKKRSVINTPKVGYR